MSEPTGKMTVFSVRFSDGKEAVMLSPSGKSLDEAEETAFDKFTRKKVVSVVKNEG